MRGFNGAVRPALLLVDDLLVRCEGFGGAGDDPGLKEPKEILAFGLPCAPGLADAFWPYAGPPDELIVKEGFRLWSLVPGAFRTLLPLTIVGAPVIAGTAGVIEFFPLAGDPDSTLPCCTAVDPPFAMFTLFDTDAFGGAVGRDVEAREG